MAKSIKIDFKDIGNNLNKFLNDSMYYFKHLTTDMMIAWAAIGVGLILIIAGVVLM